MAGHHLLNYVEEKTEIVSVYNTIYNVHLSYHRVEGVDGYVAGLKFSDKFQSMDSSKSVKMNPFLLGSAIARKAVEMIKADLHKISILGFYLLTDDLEDRRKGGARLKRRLYNAQAVEIHSKVKHQLSYITHLESEGGSGWVMSKNDFSTYREFKIFEQELEKQLSILPC